MPDYSLYQKGPDGSDSYARRTRLAKKKAAKSGQYVSESQNRDWGEEGRLIEKQMAEARARKQKEAMEKAAQGGGKSVNLGELDVRVANVRAASADAGVLELAGIKFKFDI